MLSLDTNILFAAVDSGHVLHPKALRFVTEIEARSDVAISEFALLELYVVLRSPAVVRSLSPAAAVDVCQALRQNPRWQLLGFTEDSRAFHEALWPMLAQPGFVRRRAYDWRLALSLLRQGVDEFATVNTKDFEGFGFRRVWDPLAG